MDCLISRYLCAIFRYDSYGQVPFKNIYCKVSMVTLTRGCVLKTSQTKCVACIFVSFMSSYMRVLRSFKFHCFRTLISTQLIVIRCCHIVLNIIFNYLLRGVARPLFSMYIYILCILLICIVKDKLKPVRSDLLQVVIFPDLDHKRKHQRRRRIAKLIGLKP